jgi:hypothetical protein
MISRYCRGRRGRAGLAGKVSCNTRAVIVTSFGLEPIAQPAGKRPVT